MLASIIYNHGKFCDDFKPTLKLGAYFNQDIWYGKLGNTRSCEIRNLSDENDKYTYWKELGFREYELNKKHSNRVYFRAGGNKVNIASETDALGQELLNRAIEVNKKLFSVDHERNNRIFEFRHSYANKFHGFLQDDLPQDLVRKILKADQKQVN